MDTPSIGRCFTPFTWTKQVASNYGGTRNELVVLWPKGIKEKGEIRTQWHHVIDIAPTVLEATGLPEPKMVDGVPQAPIEGVSMMYSLNDAGSKDRHLTQYFEIFGNRAIYHDGWFAGTIHKAPWEPKPRVALDKDTWELYDTRAADFNQSEFEDRLTLSTSAQKNNLILDRLGPAQPLVSNPKGIALGSGDESGPLGDQVGKKLEIIEAAIQNK